MPSGKTHDRITVWCVPWVGLAVMISTRHAGYTLLTVLGFVFAGLMFGPDLDIRSVQSKRWGWLGWIWRPYRRSLRHRSWLSHGFLAGTVFRLLYLGGWLLIVILAGLELSNTAGHTEVTWGDLGQTVRHILITYWRVWVALAIGLELGAMSHAISDWSVSAWKRQQRQQPAPATRRQRVRRSRSKR